MMVAGADKLCEVFKYKNRASVIVTINTDEPGGEVSGPCIRPFLKYRKVESSLTGGATYESDYTGFASSVDKIWLCPVTLFVFGEYPEVINITNDYDTFLPPQVAERLNIPENIASQIIDIRREYVNGEQEDEHNRYNPYNKDNISFKSFHIAAAEASYGNVNFILKDGSAYKFTPVFNAGIDEVLFKRGCC